MFSVKQTRLNDDMTNENWLHETYFKNNKKSADDACLNAILIFFFKQNTKMKYTVMLDSI
jgi:hypothetical protein